MQFELKRLQRETGITFVLVTHDQEEALAMSDRLAVMNTGRIQQIGTPEEIYDDPANQFVADFIGEANLIPGSALGRNAAVVIAVRPERIALASSELPVRLRGVVESATFLGSDTLMEVRGPERPHPATHPRRCADGCRARRSGSAGRQMPSGNWRISRGCAGFPRSSGCCCPLSA